LDHVNLDTTNIDPLPTIENYSLSFSCSLKKEEKRKKEKLYSLFFLTDFTTCGDDVKRLKNL
jgi:hypothetical protein